MGKVLVFNEGKITSFEGFISRVRLGTLSRCAVVQPEPITIAS